MQTPKAKPRLVLRFNASESCPDHDAILMSTGGQINALCSSWETDFALTGSKHSAFVRLSAREPAPLAAVEVEFPPSAYEVSEPGRAEIFNDVRMNVATHTMGTAINGTLVTTLNSEGSEPVYSMMQGQSHHQIGMTYKTYLAHAASVGLSGMQLVAIGPGGEETRCVPVLKERSPEHAERLQQAAKLVDIYAQTAFKLRERVVYKPSPRLSKTVFVEKVGVASQGYSLLHDIVKRESSVSYETLSSMFEAAIRAELGQVEQEVDEFLAQTSKPGKAAADRALIVANAASMVTNFRMSYREDGRNVISPEGNSFAKCENWNRAVPRGPFEANDCDGLSLEAIGMLREAINAPPDVLERLPYLRSVKNAIVPYYTLGLVVLGASSPEASGGGGHASDAVAGHAIAMLVPTMSLLRALAKSDAQRKTNAPPSSDQTYQSLEQARFGAMFPSETVAGLPFSEQSLLNDWETARHEFNGLNTLAIEGTTPASSVIHVSNPQKRREKEIQGRDDASVFQKIGANVFRGIKILHVGERRFYKDFVEVTVAPDNPLWTDARLRELGAAATQFVLTQEPSGKNVASAGCTPVEMATEKYAAVPLVAVDTDVAETLDYASSFAELDCMPARPKKPAVLTQFQSESLAKSMQHVREFREYMNARAVPTSMHKYHTVAFTCAFNTLVFNPAAVGQFLNKLKSVAVSTLVDVAEIEGMAVDEAGKNRACFVHLEAVVDPR